MLSSDIRVRSMEARFSPAVLRTPLKFGSGMVTDITLAEVTAEVENRSGRTARGRGAILLSDLWAWPGKLAHATRDTAMRRLTQRLAELFSGGEFGHPIDLYWDRKKAMLEIAAELSAEANLAEPINALTVLMCASPIDAAVHDGFGLANGISSYDGYGREFMANDLSRYLGPEFAGRYPQEFLTASVAETLPVFHLVGGVDKLTEDEVGPGDPRDGLPVSLDQWIRRDGVFCLKIKLRGTDAEWDSQRTVEVDRVARQTLGAIGQSDAPCLSVDFNEICASPEYVIEYCRKLQERSRTAFDDLLYLEQPTERDLYAHRFDMHELARIKPVVVDESVLDIEMLRLAFTLGWSGVALKTCKGQTNCLMYIALASQQGRSYSVQDLTNPGLALVHSASLTGRCRPMMGFEYNARQYLPDACREVQDRHPGLFAVRAGRVRPGDLPRSGLGY